ncbi:MAG: thiamine phosphate synthase [Candidatus Pelagadaptatus aseana]|uniref:thiamine phosphate synthase n=1 Tax=Candidatus Pelagadaptatus aseana TaxID=3120508 RepID=UPI0039B20429
MTTYKPDARYPIQTHSFVSRKTKPVVLAIGGSDSAGLAGIQMDSRSCHAMGVHCATAITAVTAQNNQSLIAINPVDSDILEQQIDAALALKPQAIKIGLLASVSQVQMLIRKLPLLSLPVVFDPVIKTSSDAELLNGELIAFIKSQLIPLCTVVTPNLPEAEQLLDHPPSAQALKSLGSQWAIITGGHSQDQQATEECCGPNHQFCLSHSKLDSRHLRGSGCAFAATLAATLALGYEVRDGLVITKMALQQGIEQASGVNDQKGCVDVSQFPHSHWPVFSDQAALTNANASALQFPPCTGNGEPDTLGLYPIVDSADWLARLLPQGITTAQLRVKHLEGQALADEIERAVAIGKQYNCRLFINDYWQLAIEKGAYGVHLGQEDLEVADLAAIHQAGLRLGLSNHCHFEVVRALAVKPSYIACGPTFATTTKDMPWVPHGLEGLRYWVNALPDYPLVSIAGINDHNIQDIAATGVSGIAMITAITLDDNPEQKTSELMALINEARL